MEISSAEAITKNKSLSKFCLNRWSVTILPTTKSKPKPRGHPLLIVKICPFTSSSSASLVAHKDCFIFKPDNLPKRPSQLVLGRLAAIRLLIYFYYIASKLDQTPTSHLVLPNRCQDHTKNLILYVFLTTSVARPTNETPSDW